MNTMIQIMNGVPDSSSFFGGSDTVPCVQDDERTIPFLRRLYEMIQENPDTMSFLPGSGPPIIPYEGPAPIVSLRNAPINHSQNASSTMSSNHRLGHIIVHDRKLVEKNVIPRYFNHSSFASLRRQLNYFNFERVGRGRQKGATYRNDGVVVLEDILRLKRKPNINPGDAENGSTSNDSTPCTPGAQNVACNNTVGQYSTCSIPPATETSHAHGSPQVATPSTHVQTVPVPVLPSRPTPLSVDGTALTTYTIPSGSIAYVPQAQAVASQFHQGATVYYAPSQVQLVGSSTAPTGTAHQAEGMTQHVLIPISTSSGTVVQVMAQIPAGAAPSHSLPVQAFGPVTSVSNEATDGTQRSSKSPTVRVVSQSDMSAAMTSDDAYRESPACHTLDKSNSSGSRQSPCQNSLPLTSTDKRPCYGITSTDPPEEPENKKRKLAVPGNPVEEAPGVSSFCDFKEGTERPHSTIHEAEPSLHAVSSAQCLGLVVERSTNNPRPEEQTQGGANGTRQIPNSDATVLVSAQSSQHASSFLHSQKPVDPSTGSLPLERRTDSLSNHREPNRSISDEVLYETKDGYPLKKEDLLLCAALIQLGGQP